MANSTSKVTRVIKPLQALLILFLLVFCFGCPLRGGGGIARGVRGGVRGGMRGATGVRVGPSSIPAAVYAARPARGASLVVRSNLGSSVRAGITVRQSGLIELINPASGRLIPIGRIYGSGQLWSVSRAGAASRLVARISNDGTIWQVNTSGSLVRQIGTVLTTATGVVVSIRSGPARTFPIIGTLRKGQIVQVSGYDTGWFSIVQSDGFRGWVPAALVHAEVQSDMSADEFDLLGSSNVPGSASITRPTLKRARESDPVPQERVLGNGRYNVSHEPWALRTALGMEEMTYGEITCQVEYVELRDDSTLVVAKYICRDSVTMARGNEGDCFVPKVNPYLIDDEGRKYSLIRNPSGKYEDIYRDGNYFGMRFSEGEAVRVGYEFPNLDRRTTTLKIYRMPGSDPYTFRLQ